MTINRSLVCLVLLSASFLVFGQEEDSGSEGRGWGGLGYFSPGVTFRMPNNLGLELNTLLRETQDYPQTGISLGGGGFMLLKGKYVISGGGFAILSPQVEGANSTVQIRSGGGGFNFGYVVKDDGKWLGFPHLGIGVMGMSMDVENFGNFLVNQGKFIIPPNESLSINSEIVYLDLGVNLFRFLITGGGNGPVVGVSVGYLQGLAGPPFETEEGFNLDNLSDPELSTIYFKINIGGGGFN